MDHEILQSVIEITRHRDLDSLEYSLLATLEEIIPASQIAIFKTFSGDRISGIEEVLRLTVLGTGDSEPHYKWSDQSRIIESDAALEQCIKEEATSTHQLDGGLYRILIPVSNESAAVGAISLYGKENILASLDLAQSIIKIYENYQIILNDSEHDKLTGLFNRQTFDKKLGRLLKIQSERNMAYAESGKIEKRKTTSEASSTWLVVLDFDRFKQINDTYGHIYGDEVLLILSQKMKQCFRKTDLLFRFGGDEFVIILEPVPYKQAFDALERFRTAVAAHDFPQIGHITISTGFAKITRIDYPPSVLEKADRALYFAKEHGRNCTFNYELLIAEGKLEEQKTGGSIDLF